MSAAGLMHKIAEKTDDENFRAQFDRSNPDFHGGDVREIKAGDSAVFGAGSVPEGMEGAAPPADHIPDPASWGEEYEQLMKDRKSLAELKSAINKANRAIGCWLVDLTKKAPEATKDQAIQELELFKARFEEKSEWQDEIDSILTEVKSDSPAKIKENCAFMATGTTRKIGFAQKAQLVRIKAIKKEHKDSVLAARALEAASITDATPKAE